MGNKQILKQINYGLKPMLYKYKWPIVGFVAACMWITMLSGIILIIT